MVRTAEDFYRERDLRTTSFAGTEQYQQQRVMVTLHPALAETYRGQFMFLLTVNLLARYCRQIAVVCPDVATISSLAEYHLRLPDEALTIMHGADPFGHFTWSQRYEGDAYDFHLQIGAGVLLNAAPSLTVDAAGWMVTLTQGQCQEGFQGDDVNPVGPGVAAALSVAEALKEALKLDGANRCTSVHLSCWDYGMAPDMSNLHPGIQPATSLELGETWLIGAGMVGSALGYFLRRTPVTGTLHIIDHDTIAIHNLNRSPLFQLAHVGTHKASLLAHYLRNTGLEVHPHCVLFEAFKAQHPRQANTVDLILPEANQYKVREQIQHLVPPLMLHATTSRNGNVVFGYHRPLIDDCLACRFPHDAEQPAMACGLGGFRELLAKEGEVGVE